MSEFNCNRHMPLRFYHEIVKFRAMFVIKGHEQKRPNGKCYLKTKKEALSKKSNLHKK
jgi:hypothetical protein